MPVKRYTNIAITLHWVIAALIITNVALSFIWDSLPDDQVRGMIDWHKSIGILILGLVVLRLLWRVGHTPPPYPTTFQRWEIRLSGFTHFMLYVVMIGMPLSGWVMDSAWKDAATHPMMFMGGMFEWPRIGFIAALDPATKDHIHHLSHEGHEILAKILYVLFTLHVLGALKHQFIDKQAEFQRMWWSRSN